MIIGAHALLYSTAPEETRKVLAKILRSRTVDAGGGKLGLYQPSHPVAIRQRKPARKGA